MGKEKSNEQERTDKEIVGQDTLTDDVIKNEKEVVVAEEQVTLTEMPTIKYEKITTPESKVARGIVHDCLLLNVRKTPEIDGEIVTRLKKGDIVNVTIGEPTGRFYKVTRPDGIIGFCMRKFIRMD